MKLGNNISYELTKIVNHKINKHDIINNKLINNVVKLINQPMRLKLNSLMK